MPQFLSALLPSEFIIDESNYQRVAPDADQLIDGDSKNRGRIPRDWAREPYGALPYAQPFGLPIIPRSEWIPRIKEMEEKKLLLSTKILATYAGDNPIISKDQNGTNYCWAFGVGTAMEALRCQAGLPHIPLSPAFVACQIKNFANQGGWGGDALDFVIKYGICSAKLWPQASRERKWLTDESKRDGATRIVKEWEELQNRSFEQKMSAYFAGYPVPSGYNWWGHEVCGFDPVVIGANQFGSRERNSWSESYGTKGFFILAENKATPDDAVYPRSTLPSDN